MEKEDLDPTGLCPGGRGGWACGRDGPKVFHALDARMLQGMENPQTRKGSPRGRKPAEPPPKGPGRRRTDRSFLLDLRTQTLILNRFLMTIEIKLSERRTH